MSAVSSLFLEYGYRVLLPLVLLEWPIVILSLSLFAHQLGLSFEFLFLLSFVGDFGGDLIHYMIWRYFSHLLRSSDHVHNKYLTWLYDNIHSISLLDILVVVKYIPPVTSIGLLYLWHQKVSLKKFIFLDCCIVTINSLLIVSLWYLISHKLLQSDNLSYMIIAAMISFCLIYIWVKYVRYLVIKKITHGNIPR